MRDRIAFFSDMHLTDESPERVRRFINILKELSPRTSAIFFLGDVFDFWIGPKNENLHPYKEILEILAHLIRQGIEIHFIAGNRDFYGLDSLRERYGLITHKDDIRVNIDGKNIFLSHGDHLCSKDINFDRARGIIGHPLTERIFVNLPTELALFLGKGYRNYSQRVTRNKAQRVVELCPRTLLSILSRDDIDMIICGHTHTTSRRIFRFKKDNKRKVVYTLGSWHSGSPYLIYENGEFNLVT